MKTIKSSTFELQGRKGGSCCSLLALLNARRFFGIRSPRIGSRKWEKLVDEIRCRHGGAICVDEVATTLGLKRCQIRVGLKTFTKSLPVMLTVLNPERTGCTLHSVLVTDIDRDIVNLVNFHWLSGPVIETIRWRDIPIPTSGHSRRKAWTITTITI
jgi:hypothetical protein